MRALARAADVSPSTPYNLFGSRDAVLVALLDADFAAYRARLEAMRSVGVSRLFDAIDVMCEMLEADPGFHRNVVRMLGDVPGGKVLRAVVGPRAVLWQTMLRAAVDEGALMADLAIDPLAVTLGQLVAGNLGEWASGRQDVGELRARSRYGLSLLLLASAASAGRPRLEQARVDAEKELQARWQRAMRERLLQGEQLQDLDDEQRMRLAEHLAARPERSKEATTR